MTFLIYHLLPYAVLLVFLGGLGWRAYLWLRAPEPMQIALLPASPRRAGAWGRTAWELLASPSLWRGDRWLWAGAGLFHLCLLLVALKHLRLFINPVPGWLVWLQAPGAWAGELLPLALLFLLLRRLAGPRLLMLSTRADYLLLALLLALAGSGLWLRLGPRAPLEEVKDYLLGLMSLRPAAPPQGAALTLHWLLALALLAVFPFTKLLHSLALFLNPVLGGRDTAPLKRRINPWDREHEGDGLDSPDLVAGERPFFDAERYADDLKFRWSGAGVHRVLGARERAATLPGQGDGHDL